MDISIKLKQLRHEKGLTQKELADNTGLSYAAIAAYEKALRSPNTKAMAALEQFFGVTAAELLSEKNENEENFGDFLRSVRKSQNMSQKEFAKKLCIGQPYLSGLECNRITPTPKLVKLIHLEFNIPYYDNSKPPLKAVVHRIKKNPPKPTSSGNDILFVTKVNRYGITFGRTCWYFPELTMYVGCTVSVHRDGSVWYKDKRIGFIDLCGPEIEFYASYLNRASENLSKNNSSAPETLKKIREILKSPAVYIENELKRLESTDYSGRNENDVDFLIRFQAYRLIKDASNSMLTKIWKV